MYTYIHIIICLQFLKLDATACVPCILTWSKMRILYTSSEAFKTKMFICVCSDDVADSPGGSWGFRWLMWSGAKRRDRQRLHHIVSFLFLLTLRVLPYLLSHQCCRYSPFLFSASSKVAGRSDDLQIDFNVELEFANNSGVHDFHETTAPSWHRFIKFACYFKTVHFISLMWTQQKEEKQCDTKSLCLLLDSILV